MHPNYTLMISVPILDGVKNVLVHSDVLEATWWPWNISLVRKVPEDPRMLRGGVAWTDLIFLSMINTEECFSPEHR